jgi:hypothetical protein
MPSQVKKDNSANVKRFPLQPTKTHFADVTIDTHAPRGCGVTKTASQIQAAGAALASSGGILIIGD